MGHNDRVTATDAPAPITDRPLGVIDLLDGAFHALRQRPPALVLAVAWIAIPAAVLQLVLDTRVLGVGAPTFNNGFGIGTGDGVVTDSVVVQVLIGWLVTSLAGVPVARIVGGWLIGLDTSPIDAIRYTLRRLPIIGATFVLSHVAIVLGIAFCVLPGLFASVVFCLLSPIIAMEEATTVKAALLRSKRLARSNTSATFGLIVSLFFTGAIMQGGLFFAISLFSGLSDNVSLAITTAATLIGQLLILPLNGAAMSLLYLDARYRNEGFDLELRARSAFPRG